VFLKLSAVILIPVLFIACTRQDRFPPLIKGAKKPDLTLKQEDANAKSEVVTQNGSDSKEAPLSAEELCKVSWSQWQEKYTSTNPVKVMKKTQVPFEWQPNIKVVNNILTSGNRSYFSAEFPNLQNINGANNKKSTHADFGPQNLRDFKANTRDQAIAENVKQIIAYSAADDLVIVNVDQVRAVDFFMRTRNKQVLYATHIVTTTTPFFTPETQEYIDLRHTAEGAWRDLAMLKTVGSESGFMLRKVYERIWAHTQTGTAVEHSDLDRENSSSGVKRNVVVLGDYPGANVTSAIDELPTAECLSVLGFTKVKLGLENFNYVDEINDATLNAGLAKERAGRDSEKAPYMGGKIWELSSKVNFIPTKDALIKKIQSYKGKAEVFIFGLEN